MSRSTPPQARRKPLSLKDDPDRYLVERKGFFSYKRRVPLSVLHLDPRAPHVRKTLNTRDRSLARAKRDLMEAADDSLWASMIVGDPQDPAQGRYQAAMRRVEALGFSFRPAHVLAANASLDDIVQRLEMAADERHVALQTDRALIGMIAVPADTVSRAFEIYCDEIVPSELLGKSATQRAQWKKVKYRAVKNFIERVGDKAMTEITRDDALRVYRHWQERIAPKAGRPTHSASSGNRDIGNMRVLYEAYFSHIGEMDRPNPFARLRFNDRKKKRRPAFPREWIVDRILAPGALAGLNDEARAILLIVAEIGARPSEIANASEAAICLDDDVPHLAIAPSSDPDDPREIKTQSSERRVPLLGMALAAFRKFPRGFPRYKNRENDLSATLNSYFERNGLFPTTAHKIYSLRHSFEDRMKVAGIDDELRKILMGHAMDRPVYGEGGTLKWRQTEMAKITLPFDPSIV